MMGVLALALGGGRALIGAVPVILKALFDSVRQPGTWLIVPAVLVATMLITQRSERDACATQKEESRKAAQAADAKIAAEQHDIHQQQIAERDQRIAETTEKIDEYAKKIAAAEQAGCIIDDPDIADFGRLQSRIVPVPPARPSAGGRRHPRPGSVRPPGQGNASSGVRREAPGVR